MGVSMRALRRYGHYDDTGIIRVLFDTDGHHDNGRIDTGIMSIQALRNWGYRYGHYVDTGIKVIRRYGRFLTCSHVLSSKVLN